jgi:D-alanine-D-alanine ligase
MKKFTLALLYNLRQITDPTDPRFSLEADYDDPKNISWMVSHLENLGYEVIPIEANEKAYQRLLDLRSEIDLVFNFAEGMPGTNREAFMPAIMEMLKIPYTGSSSLTLSIGLDKAVTKDVLSAHEVPVSDHQILRRVKDKIRKDFTYPLIIKPLAQGSSAGITNLSVANNYPELVKRSHQLLREFEQSVLIEPFLTGREFSVGMIGNPPQILPIIESQYNHMPEDFKPIDSLEMKWIVEETQ